MIIRFLKKICWFVWNFMAVVGVLCTLILSLIVYQKAGDYGYSPRLIVNKILNKASVTLFNEELKKPYQDELKKFIPQPLSKLADTKPYSSLKYPDKRILQVGSDKELKTPSQAAKIAKDGDIIEINAEQYLGDVALWRADNLHIRGVNGRPTLIAQGKSIEGKAIWVTRCDNLIIENIAFVGTRVRDKNGAGIRSEGTNLTVRYCLFHDNENGILGGGRDVKDSTIKVENSEFSYNGVDDKRGLAHGIYINRINRFIFQYNYVHHTKSGHHVKSRAINNIIMYNKLQDEKNGISSYAIDIAEGGFAMITGNILHQSRFTENYSLIHYQMKKAIQGAKLFAINNTIVSDRREGVFVNNHSTIKPVLINNLFSGKLALSNHDVQDVNNLFVKKSSFAAPDNYDFRLTPGSKAKDAGFDLDSLTTHKLRPDFQYVHPLNREVRIIQNKIDIGAHELIE